ncbi:VOC family protein [Oceanicoccus sp. KOV_DT_Chl]|uniref:VOC family protein n=1 Tax=Oceanicoccus sp. KOV_DT_Chl TaxID=1904639 RepID=UPI00135B23CC|nr:VOC family protein [Oceanicoccus sp. KOV_DT_Chl]
MIKIKYINRSLFIVLLGFLTACTTGYVKDTANQALTDVDVIAYGECSGAGCDSSEVETVTPAATLTGYQVSSNADGAYFFDPYGEMVAAEDAMSIGVANGSAESFYKLQFSKQGYQDIWLDYTPDFQQHSYEGSDYLITSVPTVYQCLVGAADSDGDGICDAAETHYGTSATKADTDGDGEYDDQEIFGTGSPFAVNTRKLLHYNINVSDFEASKSFYQLLGFGVLLEADVDVSDPAEAQGLNLPPYTLKAAPMALGDGFLIDLIQFYSPYDAEAPHNDIYSLGLATLSLKTDNLQADISVLQAHSIPYSVFLANNGQPVVIRFADPDGTIILLTQVFANKGINRSGETYIHGVFSTNINVSDLASAITFYQQAGFRLITTNNNIATIALQDGRHITLTESTSTDQAYEDVNHLGIARIAIETTNLDQDIKVLTANGVDFYTEEAVVPSGPLSFLRYVAFEDPDGTVIELVQYNN